MLDIIDLFIKINCYNTFHEAATKLNIPLATLQRRIKKLESNLSLALFYRERGCLRLTEPGKKFYTQCLSPVENLQNILDSFKGHCDNEKGSIKLIAPQNFIKSDFVNGLFKDFSHRYPEIKIHMILSDERLDLKKAEFDLAVRIGKLVNSQNICKVINKMDFVLAASPKLIAQYGMPKTFTDLSKLPHISFTPFKNWKFLDANGEFCIFEPEPNFIANDIEMCALAALEGRGVYYGPLFHLKKHIKNTELITLLGDFIPIKRDINLVWPDKLIPYTSRLLIDFLSDKLSEPHI